MVRIFVRTLCALVFASVAGSAWALDTKFHYHAAYDFGGDTLATPVFTNGETESVRANEGLLLGAGLSLINAAGNIETEIALSYKIGGSSAENGDIEFSTMPLEALVFHRWSHVRAGGGVTYHMSPKLEVSGAGSNFASNTKYDDALGFVVQVDYRITERMNVGARYTVIEYDQQNSNQSFDGNSFGIVFSGNAF